MDRLSIPSLFPLSMPNNHSEENVNQQQSNPDIRGTVLVVEDYAPNVMVISMMLENLGFEVIAAENGMKAIDIVEGRDTPFTAIFMDVQMQEMDGLEATQRIRQIEQTKNFRQTIIGVTAHALAGDRERCISAGMDDYISKPIHPDILATRLEVLTAAQAS